MGAEDDEERTSATVRDAPHALAKPDPDLPLERGDAVGRYIIIKQLGAGGMGIVYEAYDPELDRKVAIKLLKARAGKQQDQSWLLREAQALARLSHPNVIAVHDVGTLPGDRVFVAMELVQGDTLRAWLRKGKRSWREVVAVLQQAGRGLVAAHASGLVHRDFKPDNVLVGNDGRIRVMDFGLARLQQVAEQDPAASRESDQSIESRSPLSASLTLVGEVFGTPAYIAPEIFAGTPAGPRSDQFAFGVTLFEALHGVRPFASRKAGDPLPAPVVPPNPSDAPLRVQRAALRAIAADPEARFPAMAPLLAAIEIDPGAARRRLVAGTGVATGVTGIAIAAVAMLRRDPAPPELCTNVEQRLAGIWDDSRRRAVRTAFTATKSPFAATQLTSIERTFDGYAGGWTAMATESCRATRVTGEQPDDAMALRQGCLDQRLDELRALVALFAKADAALVERADTTARGLESLQRCADVPALRSPERPTAAVQARLAALAPKLAEAKAELAAGRFATAAAPVTAVVEGAREIAFDPAIGEALLLRGRMLIQLGKAEEALPILSEATWAALRGRRDDLAAIAALTGAQAASQQARSSEADLLLALGTATMARAGDSARELEQKRLEITGIIAGERGDMTAAVAAHEQALKVATTYASDPESLWISHQLLGATLGKSGAWAESIKHYEEALALRQKSVGPDHPDLALVLGTLGAGYDHTGQPAKARDALARAIAIRERTFGNDSPRLLVPLNNLADYHKRRQQHPEAIAIIQRALAIGAKAPGTAHPIYHTVATTHAEILHAAGRRREALAAFDRLISLEEAVRSPALATTLASRAALALDDRQWTEAVRYAERAIAGFEASSGRESPELWRPLGTLGAAKHELGDATAARRALERALAIGVKTKVPEPELARTRGLLAEIVRRQR